MFGTILHNVRQDEAWRKWAATFTQRFTKQNTSQQLSMLHGALHTTSNRYSTQIGVQPTSVARRSSTYLRGRRRGWGAPGNSHAHVSTSWSAVGGHCPRAYERRSLARASRRTPGLRTGRHIEMRCRLKVVCRLALVIWSYWYGCRERIFLNISKASNPLETP